MNMLLRRPSRVSGSGFDGIALPILLVKIPAALLFFLRKESPSFLQSKELNAPALVVSKRIRAAFVASSFLLAFLLASLSALFIWAPSTQATSLRAISVGNHHAGIVDDSVMVGSALYLLGHNARGHSKIFRQERPGAATIELNVLLQDRVGARLLSSGNALFNLGGKDESGLRSEFEKSLSVL
ncbi:MAG: hypothetical protein GY822_03110 [Deltaproteobacteria bacterium]|nr:hypothetical protein [Deltaproteobacteria bacterium]